MNTYIPVIGLEVHVELKTKSKMFCSCSAEYFGKEPNSHTCPVCLGLPGALPVPNKKAIEWCVMIGQGLNCEIPLFSKFDRKNYFYPDLAKGYQISQYDQPFAINGRITVKSEIRNPNIETNSNDKNSNVQNKGKVSNFDIRYSNFPPKGKRIRIRRVHMEEDTGKLVHSYVHGEEVSLIDFNRSGVPLVEVVTEPDFENAKEVKEYLQKLQQIVRYLDVSNADMEKGEMRLEPNISLRKCNTTNTTNNPISNKDLPLYKVEVKNINSFNFVEDAIEYEIKRQKEILEKGEIPVQETRGWNENKKKTISQRSKEEAQDYRYFPEPDIPPIRWTQLQIRQLAYQMPELPDKKLGRFVKEYELSAYNAEILTREKELANYFEEAVKVNQELKIKNQKATDEKTIANMIINKKIDREKILPAELVKQIIASQQVSGMGDDELEKMLKEVIEQNRKSVDDYKKGKGNALMFLIGQAMRKVKGRVKAETVREKLLKLLS